jgi:hypothetical protein
MATAMPAQPSAITLGFDLASTPLRCADAQPSDIVPRIDIEYLGFAGRRSIDAQLQQT